MLIRDCKCPRAGTPRMKRDAVMLPASSEATSSVSTNILFAIYLIVQCRLEPKI